MGKTFKDFKKELLQDPAVKAEYDALKPEYEAEKKKIRRKIKRQAKKSNAAPSVVKHLMSNNSKGG